METKIKQAIEIVAKKNRIKFDWKKDLTTNFRSLKIDSLAAMNLIMEVEEKLGVTLNDEDLLKITNIKELVEAFKKQMK